jgi:hypothetical protein
VASGPVPLCLIAGVGAPSFLEFVRSCGLDSARIGEQHEKGERITEWKVEWLSGSQRTADSIEQFLAHLRPSKAADKDE